MNNDDVIFNWNENVVIAQLADYFDAIEIDGDRHIVACRVDACATQEVRE